MIIVMHNYKRDEECLLTARSIKRLFPEINIEIISYSPATSVLTNTNIFSRMIETKTKYEDLGAMSCNKKNGLVFIEAINDVVRFYGQVDDKILILDEHSYILGPHFINEINNNNFDLGWYSWVVPKEGRGMAADKLVVNPVKLKHLFPLIEREEFVEKLLREQLVDKAINKYEFKTLNYAFRADGSRHTNKIKEMREDLSKVGVL